MAEWSFIWVLMFGALGLGYYLRWWQDRPTRLWRADLVQAEADRLAKRSLEQAKFEAMMYRARYRG